MAFLSENQRNALLADLNNAANVFGALSFEARSRLCAAANDPSPQSWNTAYSLIIKLAPTTTLWQALLEHTDYGVMSRPLDGDWPQIPTQQQILDALHLALQDGA